MSGSALCPLSRSSERVEAGYGWRLRAIATLYGVVCHGLFLAGVSSMVVGVYRGMAIGFGELSGAAAIAANTLLVVQFPVVHSALLSERGGRLLDKLAPAELRRELTTTLYATMAALQLLAVFFLWSPSHVVWWEPQGAVRWLLDGLYALSWLFLFKTMADAGLAIQTGFHGWGAVARGKQPRFGPFATRGTFRYIRQPVYVAFALALWSAPTWTPDRFMVTAGWTAYCLLGPLLKERRYLDRYGEPFRAYQRLVPYWLPRLRAARPRAEL